MIDENKEDYPKPILVEDLGRMFPNENSKRKARYGIYKCGFCGTEFKANTYDINRGYIKSCGCYHKRDEKYRAYIYIKSKRIDLGSFLTAVEGAIAYNNYIIENNLEGYNLNEIPEEYLI